ncbi:MAG: hypothetical protein ABI867_25995 [Kofleriaceae bacterium]
MASALAAMAVSETHACPLGVEIDHEVSWWSSWHVRMASARPDAALVIAPKPRGKVTVASDHVLAKRLVKRAADELARCYDRAFLGESLPPKLAVRVTFRITASGAATNVAVGGSETLTGCVATVIAALAIPRGGDDSFADVHVMFE